MSSEEELPLEIEVYGNKEAPTRANTQKILVELTAPSFSEDGKKPALDLVAVLDVSGSMRGHKLHNLKSAMNYLIKKIGSKDRLAVIPFATDVHKHPFGLSHMSKDGKHRAAGFVHGLEAHGDTNISAALEAGIKALHERTHKDTRAAAVFLMSDGCQNRGGDARNVAGVAHVTVDTFGFGSDHDPKEELHDARTMLAGALKALKEILEEEDEEEEEEEEDDSREILESLVVELKHFRGHMASQAEYHKHGRAYALASMSSHERQRFAARGDVHQVRLFATPRMDKYLEQAGKFHKNPNVHI